MEEKKEQLKDIPYSEINYGVIALNNRVGFSSIPEQIRELSIKKGFSLNILVMGRRGLGSSTLINSIFAAPLVDKNRSDELTTTVNEIVENNIKLKVSITTYHNDDLKQALNFIDMKNMDYYDKEQGLSKQFDDQRIHVCLYLIPGDKITSIELNGINEISKKCNLIPIISKADTYTSDELRDRKQRFHDYFKEYDIEFFETSEFNRNFKDQLTFPLATIASEKTYDLNGKIIRGRKYLWGFIDIENEEFSDFKKLQQILIYTHFEDLVSKTEVYFYNEFRKSMIGKEYTNKVLKNRLSKLEIQMEEILDDKHKKKVEELEKYEEEMLSSYREKLATNKTVVHFGDEEE